MIEKGIKTLRASHKWLQPGKTTYNVLRLRNFVRFDNYVLNLIFDASNTLKKLGQGLIYHSVASLLLWTTLCVRLGTEETNHYNFDSGFFFFQILAWCGMLAAQRFGVSFDVQCGMLYLIMCQVFPVGEKLQTGQFFTWALLLRSHAVVTYS